MSLAQTTIPPNFWQESRWFFEHEDELSPNFANRWVAVHGQRIVAVLRDGHWETIAPNIDLDPEKCATFFVGDANRVYPNRIVAL